MLSVRAREAGSFRGGDTTAREVRGRAGLAHASERLSGHEIGRLATVGLLGVARLLTNSAGNKSLRVSRRVTGQVHSQIRNKQRSVATFHTPVASAAVVRPPAALRAAATRPAGNAAMSQSAGYLPGRAMQHCLSRARDSRSAGESACRGLAHLGGMPAAEAAPGGVAAARGGAAAAVHGRRRE